MAGFGSGTPLIHEWNISYGEGGGRSLLLDVLRPVASDAAPMPAIIEVHGGAWMEGEKDVERNCLFAANGYCTASIDYRLSGIAPFPAQIQDAKAAVRWVRAHAEEYNLDPNRIGVWGMSAGGHLSALLGTTAHIEELEGDGGWGEQSSRVQAVLDVCGPTDIMDAWSDEYDPDNVISQLFGGPPSQHPDLVRLSNPIAHLDGDAAPFLIVHGTGDEVVPCRQSELLYNALQAASVEATFVPIQGGDHSLEGHWDEIGRLALEFFDRHLYSQSLELTTETAETAESQ